MAEDLLSRGKKVIIVERTEPKLQPASKALWALDPLLRP